MTKDVVIVGAGIVGCSAAWFLARAGVEVTVVDPAGVAAGASGRNNGLIEHPYDPATVPLFEESVGLLQEVLGEAMPSAPAGALLLGEDEGAARDLAEHYQRFPELEPVLLSPEETRRAEPLLGDGHWGCMLATGYPVSPADATEAVARRAREAGARFQLGGPVDLDRLRASSGEVVVCAGAWSAKVLGGVVRPDAVTPLWGVIVSVDLPARPRHPIIEGTVTRGLTMGTIEHNSPFTLLDSPSWLAVGSTLLEDEPDGSAWTRRLLDRGARFVPSIEQAGVKGTLVCARPRSFDGRPILGRVPGQERLWIASGHGGRGMSLGLASGRVLADAILSGSDHAIAPELRAARLSG